MVQVPVTLSELEGHFVVMIDKTCCAIPLHLQSFLWNFMLIHALLTKSSIWPVLLYRCYWWHTYY